MVMAEITTNVSCCNA